MEKPMERKDRILIVDDSPENLVLLGEALRERYEVIVATKGEDALRLAASAEAPDLILLDILMPDSNGFEICRLLKNGERTSRIPVIFLTAKGEEADETRGLELGAVDYIVKPFSLPIVKARIRTHIDLKRKTDLLEVLSYKDGLTGIDNRYSFNLAIRQEWDRARRERLPLGLLIADIDHFKDFNDARGHPAGDECIRRVALALRTALRRPADRLARYGGEEFALILPNTGLEGLAQVAESARAAVEALRIPRGHSGPSPWVTVSVGGSALVPPGPADPDFEILLSAADRQLYKAKGRGRNLASVGGPEAD